MMAGVTRGEEQQRRAKSLASSTEEEAGNFGNRQKSGRGLSRQFFFHKDEIVSDEIEAQCRRVLDNIRACLRAAGCELSDVIKVNAFLTDLANFDVYNAVYREYFSEPYPARTTVGAALAPGLLVEVEVVARRPG